MARKASKATSSSVKSPVKSSARARKSPAKKPGNGSGKSEISNLEREALALHRGPPAGKLSIAPLKPITTQRDLSLAYSPGVAAPCLEIFKDINTALRPLPLAPANKVSTCNVTSGRRPTTMMAEFVEDRASMRALRPS